MSYCMVQDVESRLSRFLVGSNLSEDTKPTRTDVERFIDDIAAELDSIIAGHGFAVPVTNATVVAALRGYNATGAAAVAAADIFSEAEGESSYDGKLLKQYQYQLKHLEDPQGSIIALLAEAADTSGPESNYTRDPDADGMAPVFTKDMTF